MLLRLVCLCALVVAACSTELRSEHQQQHLLAKSNPLGAFKAWVSQHKKPYLNDIKEFERRFSIWLDNLEYIVKYNSEQKDHWLHLNSLADVSHEEYKQQYLGYKPSLRKQPKNSNGNFMYAGVAEESLPTEVDWRKKGAVTPVKNQLQCGSCWAFSTTGAVEGVNAVVTKELISVSEQELVDCDTSQDQGCNGGLMDFAFQFIIDNGGIDTEEDYEYKGEDGICNEAKENRKVVTIDGYEDVPENNEKALKKAVAHQPVSVAIEADERAFQLYGGGVFNESCGTDLDHGVLVVGYGVDEEAGEYWIVKNSWSADWGDKGYIRMKAGVGKKGICGIAMQPSYPIKKGPNPPTPPPTPPSPTPQPVVCDTTHECPTSSTCCCLRELVGYCLAWGCCPLEGAVCCDDNEHCCPGELPVCDTFAGRCLPKMGEIDGSVPWYTKTKATRRTRRVENSPRALLPGAVLNLENSEVAKVTK